MDGTRVWQIAEGTERKGRQASLSACTGPLSPPSIMRGKFIGGCPADSSTDPSREAGNRTLGAASMCGQSHAGTPSVGTKRGGETNEDDASHGRSGRADMFQKAPYMHEF